MKHLKRLVLVPQHMADQRQRKKPLVPPLTAQVQELDSDIMQQQDVPIKAQAKVLDQKIERYLTFYDKQMNKPLQVSMVKPMVPEEEEKSQGEQKLDETDTDILDSVPATMKSRTHQLIKKIKANKDIGRNEQGQMVYKGTTIPGTNIVDLVNDSLCQRKNFSPKGWELFSKVLGHLNFFRWYRTKQKSSRTCSRV